MQYRLAIAALSSALLSFAILLSSCSGNKFQDNDTLQKISGSENGILEWQSLTMLSEHLDPGLSAEDRDVETRLLPKGGRLHYVWKFVGVKPQPLPIIGGDPAQAHTLYDQSQSRPVRLLLQETGKTPRPCGEPDQADAFVMGGQAELWCDMPSLPGGPMTVSVIDHNEDTMEVYRFLPPAAAH